MSCRFTGHNLLYTDVFFNIQISKILHRQIPEVGFLHFVYSVDSAFLNSFLQPHRKCMEILFHKRHGEPDLHQLISTPYFS